MTRIELASLPVAERLQMMEVLWDSLTAEGEASHVIPDWHADELQARAALLDSGAEPIADWSDAKQRLRKQAGSE